jgi:lysophospholipase L1-like esterase
MIRRRHLAVLAALATMALACEGGAGAGPKPTGTAGAKGYPSSMAALGDSITAAFGACGTFVVCGRDSWSTGTEDAVSSHYSRILAKNPKMRGNQQNFARPGAEAADLPAQASQAVGMKAQYVTILIGANDACAPTTSAMTPVASFRSSVDTALSRLRKGLPKADVLVASIPDLYRLWQVGHGDAAAVQAWNRLHTCPSMFADPTSTSAADEARRKLVRDRISDYDDALRQACRKAGERCRWDGNGVHEARFGLDQVNHLDYFHPDVQGQATLADVTYHRFPW